MQEEAEDFIHTYFVYGGGGGGSHPCKSTVSHRVDFIRLE